MQIKDSRYHRVWKIEVDQNGRKKINISDSKKNQDGTYTNWTWAFCNLVGNAKGIQVNEQDTITITNGKIEQYKTQAGEYKNSITIFDFEVTAKGQGDYGNNQKPSNQNNQQSYNNQQNNSNFESDIPF
ncbi:MAG: hypothetical protein GY777_02200 [Candidatus Brocadiaceae bacterium]|nr:hypothetical protein [Candidatus Brocadiaceae bacterium]